MTCRPGHPIGGDTVDGEFQISLVLEFRKRLHSDEIEALPEDIIASS